MTQIDRYSLAVVPLEPLFNEESLGIATGFIWKRNERFYLVTNWHVITCRRFPTGENLHSQGARPNKLRVLFNLGFQQFGKQEHLITIRDDDARPCWLVHPNRNVDVAVLPLPYDGTDPVFALNPINGSADPDLFVGVGMDCFVLGYPFGIEPPGYSRLETRKHRKRTRSHSNDGRPYVGRHRITARNVGRTGDRSNMGLPSL